ncbi:sialic acid-binding Ig-like lectin 13 [Epinephelus moara]|uniref:sialic acid-binding Ig-like lectin 13 n=1 Tax=Epinephelus moara TaxID=300413 RepID=UPI00214E502A|nr:sialic acid-binding Ig-like lectin 13 [Epinephelus moara]
MVGILNILVIACLLRGALCGEFKVIIPQTIEVVSGSCVTIPCSFDVTDQFVSKLDNTCKARWRKDGVTVFDSSQPQTTTNNGQLTGDLTKKDCTTTLNNIQPVDNNKKYSFRLDCDGLGYDFSEKISFSVRADPLRPTLTPSTLEVKEGTSVSLTCSAPAPCLSHPPNLTWTPGLGDSQETLQENQDKTKVQTSVVNFTASLHLHHGKTISCTATYNKQDGSTESAVSTSLTANISFSPQILPSSHCTIAEAQLRCSCRTVGNPSPTLQWYLDGSPVNHSFAISNLSDTCLTSNLTVDQPQEKNLSTLLCHSSNSLGSASRHFCVSSIEPQTSAQSQDQTLPVFITIVGALLVIVCALLFVIRNQRTHYNLLKSQRRGDTSTVTTSQLLSSGEDNQVPNTTEEDIYVNTSELRQADVAQPETISEPNSTNLPSSGQNNAEGASESSEKKNEEGNDVIYSAVNWKTKSKKKKGDDSLNMNQPGSSYLEEERCTVGGMARDFVSNALEMECLYDKVKPRIVEKEVEGEYAQVKFKDKHPMHK